MSSAFAFPLASGMNNRGKRYGVVVQSDALLPRSFVLIAPTSTSALSTSFRPEIEVEGLGTRVLVEQIGAVDIGRLGKLAGYLTSEENGVWTPPSSPSWASTDRQP